VIETPMAESDAGAVPSSAPRATAEPVREARAAFERGDRLEGHYWCAQGKTALTIVVDEVDSDGFDAVVAFDFAGAPGFAPAAGSFRTRGTLDERSGQVVFTPTEWIERPRNYVMVEYRGRRAKDGAIAGTVVGPECTTFAVRPAR
jgi:hypothetical protein